MITSYRPYEKAKNFVRGLKLKGQKDWQKYAKGRNRPADIPASPWRTYKRKWIGMFDWLGTHRTRGMFRPYAEARDYVRSLKFKNYSEWIRFCKSGKRPIDIPFSPDYVYKNKGWVNSADWVGRGKHNYKLYEEARDFVRNLGLGGYRGWVNYCKSGKRPESIPGCPNSVYKNKGWINWHDWLGNGFRPYAEARVYVRGLNIRNSPEWKKYIKSGKKPADIPSNPFVVYKNKGWINLHDWLGDKYRPFSAARDFVRGLGLKTYKEWNIYCSSGNKPADIPSWPARIYKDFVTMSDWLGYHSKYNWLGYNHPYKPFKEARDFARSLHLKNSAAWKMYCKSGNKPSDIPSWPFYTYRTSWRSWPNWLGTQRTQRIHKCLRERVRLALRPLKYIENWVYDPPKKYTTAS